MIEFAKREYRKDGKLVVEKSDITSLHTFANTREFRRSALNFIKYGRYTNAPKGHPEYNKFWDEEERRCIKGYSAGGLWIPGKMYFYLNYIPIKKIPDADYLSIHPNASPNKPVMSFPSFWEIDYCWWMLVEYCEQQAEAGSMFAHKVCLKTRQGGFSFKEASEGVYNFTFLKDSISKYFAATETYLVKDGIFNKVDNMLNHINKHTKWKQQRGEVDNKWHKKGSYVNRLTKTSHGRFNELIAQIMDDPDKARGGNSLKITFEEAGNMKYLREAWKVTIP